MFFPFSQNTCIEDTSWQFYPVTIEGELLKINLLQYFHNHEKQNQIEMDNIFVFLHHILVIISLNIN